MGRKENRSKNGRRQRGEGAEARAEAPRKSLCRPLAYPPAGVCLPSFTTALSPRSWFWGPWFFSPKASG